MFTIKSPVLLIGLIILIGFARPGHCFGAGNIASISKVEGQNWRHGDIEDALLSLVMARAMHGKKFNKIMVSRVYFGNWLRDYSQAIDVGTVKSVSAEAIRLLLCVLGFLTFGYGSGEFEITAERLGCYRPEDHIDNPKDYADNVDARQYDRRLRGPVDERTELAIDPDSGMKNYIANERAGIMTSAKHVRNLFGRCIELGRRYKDEKNKEDLYESLRLMGTGLHCLEDFFAHSNYCELALIEMGERDVFPHVGQRARIRLNGARGEVYPVVTGTFGGVDFLHSVTGEVSDKLTQNEIDELEGTLKDSKNADTSLLRELLDKIPSGIFGDKNHGQKIDEIQTNANAAQMQNTAVSPRNPEEFTVYVKNSYDQIMPAIKFHDDVMKAIDSAVEKIPVLPKIIEQLEEQLSVFVFSIIAPFIVPLIHQIRNELRTGSDEIIQSSEKEQHIVFDDDNANDPTHSMLAKDHFSNILNEVAGRTAAKMLHWVVPQLMEAIDDDNVDVNRLCDRIIHGVLHHPAQREQGQDGVRESRISIFESVQEWWREMGDDQRRDYQRKLSRDGVFRGENHKEGVHDTGHGHGCSGKLQMRKLYGEPETVETKIAGAAADAIFSGATGAISSMVEQQTGMKLPGVGGNNEGSREHHGLGGFLSKAGNILGEAFGKDEEQESSQHYDNNNTSSSYNQSQSSRYGRNDNNNYGQSQQSSSGRYDQQDSYGGRRDDSDNDRRSHGRREDSSYGGNNISSYGGSQGRRDDDYDSGGTRRHHGRGSESSYGRQDSSYGRQESYGGSNEDSYGNNSSSHGRHESSYDNNSSYGHQEQSGYGGREDNNYGRYQESRYGGRDDDNYGRRQESSYGGREDNYGRRQESRYGGRDDDNYGRRQESSYGGRDDDNYGRRQESSYGGRDEGGYDNNSSNYGRQENSYGGGDYDDNSYERRDEGGYGYDNRRHHGSRRDDDDGYGSRY